MESSSQYEQVSYSELARLFLRLSISAFGGPVAHIAMAEDEIVTRRNWLTRDHFLDLIAATNLIPGPNSTEVMIHVGYVTRGIPGAILAGACFIGPAFLLTLVLSVLYVSTGTIPEISALLWGIKPIIVAIIAYAGYRLARTALKTRFLWILFAASVVILLVSTIPEVVVMVGAGLLYAVIEMRLEATPGAAVMLFHTARNIPRQAINQFAARYSSFMPALSLQAAVVGVSLWSLFFYFFKIGLVLFGSGYILIAYIQQDVVNSFGWLSGKQLLDAIAIGQATPGPVLTTVTVVGYIIAGLPGAIVATLGVFLPSFVLVIFSTAPLIPKMRKVRALGAFLSGINAGVIAAILVTLIDLFTTALKTPDGAAVSPVSILLMVGALVLLLRTKINATWLIAMGGVVGLVYGFVAR